MSRRTTLTVVTLLCLQAGFGDRATADHRGRASASAGASSVGRISSLLDDETTDERPLVAISGSRTPVRRYFSSPYRKPLASSKLHRLPTGSSRRPSSFLSDADQQVSLTPSVSGTWPPSTLTDVQRYRYQLKDDQNQSPSRRKKLKSDVFYAVRGRRGYDDNDDDVSHSSSNSDQEDMLALTDDGPERVDDNWTLVADLPAGRAHHHAERSPHGRRHRLDDTLGFGGGLGLLNDEHQGEQEFERTFSGGKGWSSLKEKREPPTGFHAIRGKRQTRVRE